jgi:hypothetical protein
MSLINDALKRTRDASNPTGGPRAVIGVRYRVSGGEEKTSVGTRSGLWVSLLVVVMAGVTMLVFSLRVVRPVRHFREAMEIASETNASEVRPLDSSPTVVVHRSELVTVPVVTPRPEKKTNEDHLVDKVVEKLKAEQATAKVEPPAPVAVVAPPPPEAQKFVLQGITSGPGWREAMINGYAVREGDDLDGARVTAIEPRHVKLQAADHEILLRMP